ncbi:MAG TPA: hypothetical protein VK474_00435 [Chthoniobacterales bacterium]|nr:hypothetical protein [Chthoniobacterales bacterium]
MGAKFKAKIGDTKRCLRLQFLQDEAVLDEEPESVTVKIVGAAAITRDMTAESTNDGTKWFYRPSGDDYTALGGGVAQYNCTLTWADGTQATCPTVGTYSLPISAPL